MLRRMSTGKAVRRHTHYASYDLAEESPDFFDFVDFHESADCMSIHYVQVILARAAARFQRLRHCCRPALEITMLQR